MADQVIHQLAEFELAVAVNAGIWGSGIAVFVYEIIDDLFEFFLEIQHGKAYPQACGHLFGIAGIIGRAACLVPGILTIRLAEAHKNARAVVTGLLEKTCRYTTVDSAAHGHQDFVFYVHHFLYRIFGERLYLFCGSCVLGVRVVMEMAVFMVKQAVAITIKGIDHKADRKPYAKRIRVIAGRPRITKIHDTTPIRGKIGLKGTLKPRCRCGSFMRKIITPKHTNRNAKSVPMQVRATISLMFASEATSAANAPTMIVFTCGVLIRVYAGEYAGDKAVP